MEDTENKDNEIAPPVLTFPPEVAEWVIDEYKNADVILEYGSGGSTVEASKMKNKTIFSVESDRAWSENMEAYFAQAKPPSLPKMHWADIGPTGAWGRPANARHYQKYWRYPTSVWDREDFVAPDVVLVDGRFRVACALTTMIRTPKEVTLLMDDYVGRRNYYVIEDFLDRLETRGRMAKFKVKPTVLSPEDLSKFIAQYARFE